MKSRKKSSARIAMYHSLRTTVIAFVAFFIFAVCFLVAMYTYGIDSNENYLIETAEQKQEVLTQKIESDIELLRSVAISLEQEDLSDEARIIALLDMINLSNQFVRMGLADLDGNVNLVDVDQSVGVYTDQNLAYLPEFTRASNGAETLTGTVISQVTGELVNYYMVPVEQNGSVAGVLCAVNESTVYEQLLNAHVYMGAGFYLVLDREGKIVLLPPEELLAEHSNTSFALGDYLENQIIFDDHETSLMERQHIFASTSIPRQLTATLDGQKQIVITQPLDINSGWMLVAIVPNSVVNASFYGVLIGAIVLILLALLLFVFLLHRQLEYSAASQRSLEALAFTDFLTGLPNRSKLMTDAKAYLKEHPRHPLTVWSCDIQRFFRVNSLFGNETGDKLLMLMAQYFEEQDNESLFFARLGTDQFAGILPYTSEERLKAWFARLDAYMQKQEILPARQIVLELAVGFYCTEQPKLQMSEMLNRSSIARKSAKTSGGSTCGFFTSAMEERLKQESRIEAGGRQALANGEFIFYLQPKVSIQGRTVITGAEALVRWQHPEQGLISPALFVPLFEENGFIVELDRYIFEQVCIWYQGYLAAGRQRIQVSINVSRLGILREDFIDYYVNIRKKYQIPEGYLELEFTEGIVQNDYHFFRSILEQLKDAGFACSLDDFGSAYSSLNVLKELPIDVLKLDGVFFRGGVSPERESIIVSNFIATAKQLNIRTVAEGIETLEQVAFLKASGCDKIQGYVFSKPISVEKFESLDLCSYPFQ